MNGTYFYLTPSYVEPPQGSNEERRALSTVYAMFNVCRGDFSCPLCKTKFDVVPSQNPPSLMITCHCGDLVIFVDENSTLADLNFAIRAFYTPDEEPIVTPEPAEKPVYRECYEL